MYLALKRCAHECPVNRVDDRKGTFLRRGQTVPGMLLLAKLGNINWQYQGGLPATQPKYSYDVGNKRTLPHRTILVKDHTLAFPSLFFQGFRDPSVIRPCRRRNHHDQSFRGRRPSNMTYKLGIGRCKHALLA